MKLHSSLASVQNPKCAPIKSYPDYFSAMPSCTQHFLETMQFNPSFRSAQNCKRFPSNLYPYLGCTPHFLPICGPGFNVFYIPVRDNKNHFRTHPPSIANHPKKVFLSQYSAVPCYTPHFSAMHVPFRFPIRYHEHHFQTHPPSVSNHPKKVAFRHNISNKWKSSSTDMSNWKSSLPTSWHSELHFQTHPPFVANHPKKVAFGHNISNKWKSSSTDVSNWKSSIPTSWHTSELSSMFR